MERIANTRKPVVWLPEWLYESLPYLYVLTGSLFNAGIIYVGLDVLHGAAYYLATGTLCTLVGLVVFFRRQMRRRPTNDPESK